VDAAKRSRIRLFLHAVFSGNLTSQLLALIEKLKKTIRRFALLNRKWT
jgi:hypothetical protein